VGPTVACERLRRSPSCLRTDSDQVHVPDEDRRLPVITLPSTRIQRVSTPTAAGAPGIEVQLEAMIRIQAIRFNINVFVPLRQHGPGG
jgi:hypothetical protein